jgi:hypothetical protein
MCVLVQIRESRLNWLVTVSGSVRTTELSNYCNHLHVTRLFILDKRCCRCSSQYCTADCDIANDVTRQPFTVDARVRSNASLYEILWGKIGTRTEYFPSSSDYALSTVPSMLPTHISYRRRCSFFSNGSTAPWGPRPPHFSRLHDHILFLDTPHSVGLLWTRDQLVSETSTWQHTTLTTDRHPCPRWDSNTQF